MKIKIDAIDTLFFKDGKPFNMGDESWADGIFPPPMSVITGALRTAWFSYHPDEINKAGGDGDPTDGLKVTGMAVMIGSQVYYPAPLDMVLDRTQKMKRLEPLQLAELKGITSSALKKTLTFPRDGKIETAQGLLVESMSLSDWLQGLERKTPYLALSELVHTEPKTGIGRENTTRSAADGKLYRVGMRRPVTRTPNGGEVKLSLIVEFTGLVLPEEGFFKLGGEGKVARFSRYESSIIPTAPVLPDGDGKIIIKLYLMTPGIFESGSLPDLPDEIKAELVAASCGKSLRLGGYDMKQNFPKPMKLAVPAGSVYYLECERSEAEKILSLNGSSLSRQEYSKQGFGIIFVGVKNA